MRRVVPWVCCLVWVLALVAPAAASADGAVTRAGGELRYVSDSQDAENLVITRQTAAFECSPGAAPCLQFANGPQNIRDQVAGSDCVQVIATVVACSPTGVTSIRLTLNDGDDFVRMGDSVPPTTMDGSFGNDNLSSANGADTVLGGAGDDEISDDGGVDVLNGGAGNDVISLGGGNDDVIGGADTDTVILDSGDDTVRLDDLPNDGPAGAAMNIHTDVEVIDGAAGSDNLFGNASANTFRGGSGNDLLDGSGGPDVLEGNSGADELDGGPDVDRVVYPESSGQTITLDDVRNDGAPGELDNVHSDIEDVAAGPGNDVVIGSDAANVLDGGAGDDRLEGRGGVDSLLGGVGADALFARDGVPERVDCGEQSDTGEADTTDTLVACEGVLVSSALVPDVDGDGATKPSDCNDADASIHPGAVDVPDNRIDEDCSGVDAVNLDRDGDGFLRPSDCNDSDARVHPGAVDIAGNAIDEDCRGGAAPFPVLDSTIAATFSFGRRFTLFTAVTIRRVHAGSTLRLTCNGSGCPFRSRTQKLKRDQRKLTLVRPLRRARLRPGARFEVRITQPGAVGTIARYTVRAGKPPARSDRCLPPGTPRPTRCP